MSAATTDIHRKRELALIHLAKATLGLSRADYEHVLHTVTGAISAADLDAAGRDKLLKHFKAKGFQVKPSMKSKQTRTLAQDAQSRKVRALWLMLHALGQVRDPSEAALAAYVKRMVKVDALQWADHYAVIEALKAWAMRYLPQYLQAAVKALDIETLTIGQRDDLVNMLGSLNGAKSKGITALFDYYWPIYSLLDEVQTK